MDSGKHCAALDREDKHESSLILKELKIKIKKILKKLCGFRPRDEHKSSLILDN